VGSPWLGTISHYNSNYRTPFESKIDVTPPPGYTIDPMDCTPMETVRIYIVQHGETEENKQKIALNSEGKRQADLMADAVERSSVRYLRLQSAAKRILIHQIADANSCTRKGASGLGWTWSRCTQP